MKKPVLIIAILIILVIAVLSIFSYRSAQQEQKQIEEINQKINGFPYTGFAESCNYEDAQMQTCCVGSVYDMQQLGGYPMESNMCKGQTMVIDNIECLGEYEWCIPEKEQQQSEIPNEQKICETDDDCVPASCCHATDVVNKEFAPNCDEMMCTMSCDTVLDCGQGEPACSNGMCTVKVE